MRSRGPPGSSSSTDKITSWVPWPARCARAWAEQRPAQAAAPVGGGDLDPPHHPDPVHRGADAGLRRRGPVAVDFQPPPRPVLAPGHGGAGVGGQPWCGQGPAQVAPQVLAGEPGVQERVVGGGPVPHRQGLQAEGERAGDIERVPGAPAQLVQRPGQQRLDHPRVLPPVRPQHQPRLVAGPGRVRHHPGHPAGGVDQHLGAGRVRLRPPAGIHQRAARQRLGQHPRGAHRLPGQPVGGHHLQHRGLLPGHIRPRAPPHRRPAAACAVWRGRVAARCWPRPRWCRAAARSRPPTSPTHRAGSAPPAAGAKGAGWPRETPVRLFPG